MTSPEVPSEQVLVLREQLPLPRPYLAPRTSTEKSLAEIWRTVLNMDYVGRDDDYNDLGGDSLHATAIFTRIQDTFRIALPMAVLAKASTVAELAPLIDELITRK